MMHEEVQGEDPTVQFQTASLDYPQRFDPE